MESNKTEMFGIGEAKQELLNGNKISKSNWGSSIYLELVNGRIWKMIVKTSYVWNPTQEDILADDYFLYKYIN